MKRVGLVGAMPSGNRWRAQGSIDGSSKYLGTFDSEEEAHEVFVRERDRMLATRVAKVALIERLLLDGPTFVYEGRKGRGADLNGKHFKVLKAHGTFQSIVVPLTATGTLDFAGQTTVTSCYLKPLTNTPPTVPPLPEFLQGFETEHFPATSCTIPNAREPSIRDSADTYLCFIVDRRFPNEGRIEYLRPYTAEGIEEQEGTLLYGWNRTSGDGFVDHVTRSIHDDSDRVIAWKKVETIAPFGPTNWPETASV